MPRLTQRELQAARKLRASIPKLMTSDVVIAVLPDGKHVLAKGRDRLDGIVATGVTRNSLISFVPVLSLEAAAGLEQVLGGDGSYTQPGPVGHA